LCVNHPIFCHFFCFFLSKLMSVTPTPPNPVAAEITAAELKALKASQALLNNFSRFLPAVFFQYQRFSAERFCFNYASEAVERLFEFSAAELCADVNILFRKVHPADLSAFMLSVRTAANICTSGRMNSASFSRMAKSAGWRARPVAVCSGMAALWIRPAANRLSAA
jgi:hypothetical protein